jgi:hypothetical protein
VPVPGDVNVPTGVIVVDTCGGFTDGVTGMLTGADVDGLACPGVVTLAVGDTEDGDPAGIDTPIATGGRLAPGCTVAFVEQVTC